MPELAGLLTAMVTPFHADGPIDEDATVASAVTCSPTGRTAWSSAGRRGKRRR